MLQALVSWSLRCRIVVVVLAALLLVVGMYAAGHARLDVFPEFAPPLVVVQTECAGLSPGEVQAVRAAENLRNIIYLHSHDTGRYIQPYGYAIPTPNLQQLAEQGVLFRKAFNAAPTCSPSRAALLTGQAAHSSGMTGLAHLGFSLNDYSQHILHTLRKSGYYSALAGVQHVARDPKTIGYDKVIKIQNTQAKNVAPAAAAFIKNPPKQPYYIEIGFFETHRKFHPPTKAEDRVNSRYIKIHLGSML